MNPQQLERYARNINMPEFGMEGQMKLLKSRVLVIGAGGLGSPVLEYLAAAGVGTIVVADGDTVSLSNLQRQVVHDTAGIGRNKALSAKERLNGLNPDVEVVAIERFVDADEMARLAVDADIVVDATDNFDSKFMINDTCVALGKPFVHGGIFRYRGQVMTCIPGHACYRCVFPEAPEMTGEPAGPIGVLPGVIGSLQAAEVIKYLTGSGELLVDTLLLVDLLEMQFTRLAVAPEPECQAHAGR